MGSTILCELAPALASYGASTGSSDSEESACSAEDRDLIPGWEALLEKGRLPTPVFLPGEFHGKSLVD